MLLLLAIALAGMRILVFAPAPAGAIKPPPKKARADKGKIFTSGCMVLGKKTRSPREKCVFGKRGSSTHVVLLGDSHALQYGPTLIRLANQKGWRLTTLVRQSCTPAQVKLGTKCDPWRANTMRRIVRVEKPDLVVVSTATTNRYRVIRGGRTLSRKASRPYLIKGMKKTLRRLRDSGAKVVLIRDQHRAPRDTPECVRKYQKRANKKCAFTPSDRRERQDFDYRAARRVKKVRVIDPSPRFCPQRPCRVVERGILIYRDSYHITATYARHIAPWLGRKLPSIP
jgi:hypothetical protein